MKSITWKVNAATEIPPMWILWAWVEAYQSMGIEFKGAN